MMANINISSVFEYGRPSGILRKVGCVGSKEVNGPQAAAALRVMAKKADVPGSTPLGGVEKKMDVDDEHRGNAAEDGFPINHPPSSLLSNSLFPCVTTADSQIVPIFSFQPQPLPHHSPHIPFHRLETPPHSRCSRTQHPLGRTRAIFRDCSQEDHDQPGLDERAGQAQRPPKRRKMGHAHQQLCTYIGRGLVPSRDG